MAFHSHPISARVLARLRNKKTYLLLMQLGFSKLAILLIWHLSGRTALSRPSRMPWVPSSCVLWFRSHRRQRATFFSRRFQHSPLLDCSSLRLPLHVSLLALLLHSRHALTAHWSSFFRPFPPLGRFDCITADGGLRRTSTCLLRPLSSVISITLCVGGCSPLSLMIWAIVLKFFMARSRSRFYLQLPIEPRIWSLERQFLYMASHPRWGSWQCTPS